MTRLKHTDIPTVLLVGQNPILVKVKKMPKDEYGEYEEWNRQININVNQPTHMLKDTLIHEWLHAVIHMSGVSALLEDREGLEEALVRAVTSAILPAIDVEKLRPAAALQAPVKSDDPIPTSL